MHTRQASVNRLNSPICVVSYVEKISSLHPVTTSGENRSTTYNTIYRYTFVYYLECGQDANMYDTMLRETLRGTQTFISPHPPARVPCMYSLRLSLLGEGGAFMVSTVVPVGSNSWLLLTLPKPTNSQLYCQKKNIVVLSTCHRVSYRTIN